jgi:hypothetical protein
MGESVQNDDEEDIGIFNIIFLCRINIAISMDKVPIKHVLNII